jgi:hypothetical protein
LNYRKTGRAMPLCNMASENSGRSHLPHTNASKCNRCATNEKEPPKKEGSCEFSDS